MSPIGLSGGVWKEAFLLSTTLTIAKLDLDFKPYPLS